MDKMRILSIDGFDQNGIKLIGWKSMHTMSIPNTYRVVVFHCMKYAAVGLLV